MFVGLVVLLLIELEGVVVFIDDLCIVVVIFIGFIVVGKLVVL